MQFFIVLLWSTCGKNIFMNYRYKGTIPASKSLMNRALICSTYRQDLLLRGDSSCDDVTLMKTAVAQLQKIYGRGDLHSENNLANQEVYNCGAAGTVLRFLALRLSRVPGRHILKGTPRLMQRPQQDLLDLLTRLGVQFQLSEDSLTLNSEGWKNLSAPIAVNRGVSSQFASGLILNAWDLERDLVLKMNGNPISEGYLDMTLSVVEALGMKVDRTVLDGQDTIAVKKHSRVLVSDYSVESDLSSSFAVAAFAALNGEAVFDNFPNPSLQPDFDFVNILKSMNVSVELSSGKLTVQKQGLLKGVSVDLKSCPDLFPVLAVLCAFASTPSRLYGAPHLIHKESDRISKVSELLEFMKVPHQVKNDGMLINPHQESSEKNRIKNSTCPFEFNTDHDHRLAFAAALIKSQGWPLKIMHPEVVSKSFPEFWQVVGLVDEI